MAGLATGIGSFLAFFTTRTNTKFLSISLGFSAGVMIYVSMIEIFVKAQDALVGELGDKMGNWMTVAGFFGGMLLIALIDKLIPKTGNPHELKKVEEMNSQPQNQSLYRMGTYSTCDCYKRQIPKRPS
jgi:ZIP family zinc transporter